MHGILWCLQHGLWLRNTVLGVWENSGKASDGVSTTKHLRVYYGLTLSPPLTIHDLGQGAGLGNIKLARKGKADRTGRGTQNMLSHVGCFYYRHPF